MIPNFEVENCVVLEKVTLEELCCRGTRGFTEVLAGHGGCATP